MKSDATSIWLDHLACTKQTQVLCMTATVNAKIAYCKSGMPFTPSALKWSSRHSMIDIRQSAASSSSSRQNIEVLNAFTKLTRAPLWLPAASRFCTAAAAVSKCVFTDAWLCLLYCAVQHVKPVLQVLMPAKSNSDMSRMLNGVPGIHERTQKPHTDQ